MLKKTFAVLGTLALALTLASCGEQGRTDDDLIKDGWVKDPVSQGYVKDPEQNGYVKAPVALPAASKTEFTKDKSPINAANLVNYLHRDDVVYIDLRDNQKGYQAGHLRGFESIEFFGLIYDTGTTGNQLFKSDYSPRYKESEKLINTLFPKDKAIFLNCTSGARVVKMMDILNTLNYDMSKVYNVGGWQDFQGEPTLKPYLVANPFVTATCTYEFLNTLHPIEVK